MKRISVCNDLLGFLLYLFRKDWQTARIFWGMKCFSFTLIIVLCFFLFDTVKRRFEWLLFSFIDHLNLKASSINWGFNVLQIRSQSIYTVIYHSCKIKKNKFWLVFQNIDFLLTFSHLHYDSGERSWGQKYDKQTEYWWQC